MGLRVRTYLAPSRIAGLGLFAAEDIAPGTITWAWEPGLDRAFAPAELAALSAPARDFLATYAYWDETLAGYALCNDNARFMNHSAAPNTRGSYDGFPLGGADVATRLIRKGEELTCDYRSFDPDAADKLPAGA